MEIGESARLASEIFAGSHVMTIPVPVDPLRYSEPFGYVSASAATAGSVESTTKDTVPLAVLERRSVAERRTKKFETSTLGTVHATLPTLATDEATEVQFDQPSDEASTVTGFETGEASKA